MPVKLLREYVREVVESTTTFSLEEFKTSPDPEGYLASHATELGSGVGRTVYDIGGDQVIKWARNKNGIRQNKRESMITQCAAEGAPIVPVSQAAPNHAWVIVPKVEHVTGSALDRIIKMVTGLKNTEELIYVVEAGSKNDPDWADALPTHQKLYKTNDWYRALFDTVVSCKLIPTELHADNWGLDENADLVLIDPGM